MFVLFRARWALLFLSFLLIATAILPNNGSRATAQTSPRGRVLLPVVLRPSGQPSAISYWGMNVYVSKAERGRDNRSLLADSARAAGVQWTREELPWDLIEPRPGAFQTNYDQNLRLAAEKGFGIIGMLLTTPPWARDASCRASGERYWCPPADVASYARFAGWMAERYDGDGRDDAPGSPRVAAWQIWNEPNDTALWPDIGGDANARKRRYGDMLVAAYAAIKAADASAVVATGGTYIYDGSCAGGVCDGLNFFNAPGGVFPQVPAARRAFDVFAIHPYIPTNAPDDGRIPRVLTVEGRIRQTRAWLNRDINRADAPLWISEVGWCTAPGVCPGGVGVSEEQQANYLVRTLVVAQQLGVQHTSWFQFEDAFNNERREWANAAIVRNFDGVGYPPKPAYNAYRTLATELSGALPIGTGPLHTNLYDPAQPLGNSNGVAHYRYIRGGATIDIVWRPSGNSQVALPALGTTALQIDRDGGRTALAASGGTLRLNVNERPIIVVQE